jgi:hypothetical protein
MTDLNSLPFSHLVWFMENGDDQWRICAATMDETDAMAVAHNINSVDHSGAAQVLPIGEVPTGKHY